MSVKQIPERILEEALDIIDEKGLDLLKIHPKEGDARVREEKAYNVMCKFITNWDNFNTVEDGWVNLTTIYFQVGYAYGYRAGMRISQFLEAESAPQPAK